MTLDAWQARLTRVVAREIRRHRDRRRWSAQQLADRTAELGMPIPRSVLANIESGRRDTVTLSEVLVLAAALSVAPTELISPVGFDEEIEILPGHAVDPLLALRWIDGELALDMSGPDLAFTAPAAGEESGPRLLETHASLIEQIEVNDSEAARAEADARGARLELDAAARAISKAEAAEDAGAVEDARKREAAARRDHDDAIAHTRFRAEAAARYRETAATSLRYVRAEMARRGMILPPLPLSLNPDTLNGESP